MAKEAFVEAEEMSKDSILNGFFLRKCKLEAWVIYVTLLSVGW